MTTCMWTISETLYTIIASTVVNDYEDVEKQHNTMDMITDGSVYILCEDVHVLGDSLLKYDI